MSRRVTHDSGIAGAMSTNPTPDRTLGVRLPDCYLDAGADGVWPAHRFAGLLQKSILENIRDNRRTRWQQEVEVLHRIATSVC